MFLLAFASFRNDLCICCISSSQGKPHVLNTIFVYLFVVHIFIIAYLFTMVCGSQHTRM